MKQIAVSDLKLKEILTRIPFFSLFSANERAAFFAQSLKFYLCKKDKYIINSGDKETNFYIILSGQASVRVKQDQQEVAILSAGYFIGEGAFVNSRPRSASIIAKTDVMLICLDQESLMRFPASIREKIKDQIIEGMALRLADMNLKYINVDN